MAKNELTAVQVAEKLGVASVTVRKWCQRGLFPTAYMYETPLGALWMIPQRDLINFTPPPMGRPPKTAKALQAEKASTKKGRKK